MFLWVRLAVKPQHRMLASRGLGALLAVDLGQRGDLQQIWKFLHRSIEEGDTLVYEMAVSP